MTEQNPNLVYPQLTSVQQSDVQFDSEGRGFTTLVGIDRTGGLWTAIGVIQGRGYFLNPWISQPRPVIEPKQDTAPEAAPDSAAA